MPLPLMNHSALALFAQRMRIPTSARSIGLSVSFGFVLVRVRGLAFWSGFASACAAQVNAILGPCGDCALVFLCIWELIRLPVVD